MMEFYRKLKWLVQRRRKEDELREELEFHILEEAEQSGSDAARRELGNLTRIREETRSAWGWTMVEQFAQDLRYAVRSMGANKLFSLLAILSLALGIGANTAIYSFMDAILLRSLPVADPGSLVVLNWHAKQVAQWGSFVMHTISGSTFDDPKSGTTSGIFPYPAFELFQNDSIFSSVFAYHPVRGLNVTFKGHADVANGEYVSGDYFRGLAVPPAAGRLIIPEDDRTGARPVAVISFALSQRRFGGPANAAGQSILINNLPFIVAGVTPPEFFGVDPGAAPEVFLPMHADLSLEGDEAKQSGVPPQYLDSNYYWAEVMGRIRPGVSLAEAQAALAPLFHQWVETTASSDAERANLPSLVVNPGAAGLDSLRRKYSKPLYVLMTMVGLILAIACANVANLLLARAAARRREIALRLSVGAGRFRVIRQLLTESVLLASFGGLLGVLFAIWGIRFLTLLLANGNTNFTLHAELNWHVLSVAIVLSLLTGALFGLAPAMQLTRVDVISAIKETRAGQAVGRRSFWRISLSHSLIVGQIALSLLMLIAAGLFVRTMANLESMQLGFNRENLLLFELDARKAGHKDPEITAFYGDLLKRFSAIPGVREATLSNESLIRAGYGMSLAIHGKPADGANRLSVVGPRFMKTMQIQLVAGRDIDERDRPDSQPVAIVSEFFAKVNFPGENPMGQHVALLPRPGRPPREWEIVGIAKDVRYGGLKDKARPVMYITYNQGFPYPQRMTYELRTAGDPLVYANTVREIVHQADSLVPLASVRSQVQEIDRTINQEIVFAELCTAFAILALVIACVGLYGTVSYNVARRTAEIGIRMALGAQRARVIRMILAQVFVLAAIGLAIGVPAALGSSKLLASFLFGLKPNDPLAITAAALILLVAAIIAGYVPARRASRIDPMAALRHE
jgi:macrolide transport system ATP-binding/permease protein